MTHMSNPAAAMMRAAVLVAPGRIELHRVPVPEPGRGEVRVRLEGCGVCASNLEPWAGNEWTRYPLPPGELGHEGWGTIDAIGEDVAGLKPGMRVATLSHRSYAEFDVATAEQIVPLPARCGDFPGEPLGCAMNILARSDIAPGQAVAIVGIGFLGALLPMAVNVALIGFEVLVAFLQAYVFAILTSIYLHDAVHLH